MNCRWRLIVDDRTEAHENMAIDEAIGLSVKEGKSPPTLRIYKWDRTSVTLGRYQQAKEVNLRACEKKNVPVVRRPTGGRAILHGRDLTYSFSSRTEGPFSSGGLLETYAQLSQAFVLALRALGLAVKWKNRREKGAVLTGSPLCFQSVSFGEITLRDRKIMGSAQKRWEGAFLQQGTIMLEVEPELQEELFSGITARMVKESMIGILEVIPGLNTKALTEAIVEGFKEVFGVSFSTEDLTEEEKHLTRKLLNEKYLRKEYLLER